MIKPLQDFILIQPVEEKEEKIGSIIIPGTVARQQKTQQATVLKVGPGKQSPITCVSEGDTVLLPHYAGVEVIDFDGNKLVLVRVTDILAKIK